ncbi:hypothetical protein AY601_1110 [Pedobacter cryoconitis]|uniref:Uncharacterized protein n=1 Tax=Pedobacter cryoconitis TaxID=188932 RepID=A0A127VAK7_9SPHI|nr:hypothetical protein [Pedobacter cryoconitis]AMP98038.1 hypothetical protein AY601_1110 [Pedobacter cryoconitis]
MKKETKDNLKELPKICVTELSDNERLNKDIFRSDVMFGVIFFITVYRDYPQNLQ